MEWIEASLLVDECLFVCRQQERAQLLSTKDGCLENKVRVGLLVAKSRQSSSYVVVAATYLRSCHIIHTAGKADAFFPPRTEK